MQYYPYSNSCGQLPAFLSDPCAAPEGGRLRHVAFVAPGVQFADWGDPLEWQAKAAAGQVILIPNTQGTYNGGESVTTEGFGEARQVATGRNHSATYAHREVAGNTAFYDALNFQQGWQFVFATENLLWLTHAPALVKAGAPVEAGVDSMVKWSVTVEWSSRHNPQPIPLPAGIFHLNAPGYGG
jgi:hypothetical protein